MAWPKDRVPDDSVVSFPKVAPLGVESACLLDFGLERGNAETLRRGRSRHRCVHRLQGARGPDPGKYRSLRSSLPRNRGQRLVRRLRAGTPRDRALDATGLVLLHSALLELFERLPDHDSASHPIRSRGNDDLHGRRARTRLSAALGRARGEASRHAFEHRRRGDRDRCRRAGDVLERSRDRAHRMDARRGSRETPPGSLPDREREDSGEGRRSRGQDSTRGHGHRSRRP